MFRLVTTYYRERNPLRRQELDLCLSLNCSTFDSVVVLAENVYDPANGRIGCWQRTSRRPLYSDAVATASGFDADDVVVIANCDIIVPRESLELIESRIARDDAYCLTRWEPGRGVWNVDYSQDAWAFRGAPRLPENAGDFRFGVPGCDNKFAAELQRIGYRVLNPSRSIATYHWHATGQRTATNVPSCRVELPYLYVAPHRLGDSPAYRTPDHKPQGGSAVQGEVGQLRKRPLSA